MTTSRRFVPSMIIVGAVVAIWAAVQITREAPSDIMARYSKMAPDLASVFGGDERENRCIIELRTG